MVKITKKQAVKTTASASPVLTIGHSNLPTEQFIAMLKANGVKVLVDVRTTPFSRYQSQFNRNNIALALQKAGIEYIYRGKSLGGIGGPSVADPHFQSGIKDVVDFALLGRTPAMMCSEKDPKTCHRAMKLTAFILRKHPGIKCGHILQGHAEPVPALEFEKTQKPSWGWYELFPSGSYGAKETKQEQLPL